MHTANPEILEARQDLIDGMLSYMQADASDPDFDAGYTEVDVVKCAAIVDGYLSTLTSAEGAADPAKIMQAVEQAVLALNGLNDACDGGLIETDQREQLCDIIIRAAQDAGLETDEDITEEWRDW
jgi:hypothetical protein